MTTIICRKIRRIMVPMKKMEAITKNGYKKPIPQHHHRNVPIYSIFFGSLALSYFLRHFFMIFYYLFTFYRWSFLLLLVFFLGGNPFFTIIYFFWHFFSDHLFLLLKTFFSHFLPITYLHTSHVLASIARRPRFAFLVEV